MAHWGTNIAGLSPTADYHQLLPCYIYPESLCRYSESVIFKHFHPTLINKEEKGGFAVVHLGAYVAG